MSATNRGAVRRKDDAYATPPWCVRAILPYLPRVGTILEPCAGDGGIIRVLHKSGVAARRLHAVEINPKLAALIAPLTPGVTVQAGDCLKAETMLMPHGLIITNPPFSLAIEIVELAVGTVERWGTTAAFLLRLPFLEGQKRAEFHKKHPADIYVFAKRPSFTLGGTDATAYAWFVWGPGRGNRWSILESDGEAG